MCKRSDSTFAITQVLSCQILHLVQVAHQNTLTPPVYLWFALIVTTNGILMRKQKK